MYSPLFKMQQKKEGLPLCWDPAWNYLKGREGWLRLAGVGACPCFPGPELGWRRQALQGSPWGCHSALCDVSVPSRSLSFSSVASTLTAAASAGRLPSRASASESWGPGNCLSPSSTAHIIPKRPLPVYRLDMKYTNKRMLKVGYTGLFEEMFRNTICLNSR